MIFPQSVPRVAGLVLRHDFVLEGLASEPSAGLPLGNGDLCASLHGGPGLLALSVRKSDAPVGEIHLHISGHESQPSPRIARLPLYQGERAAVKTSPSPALRERGPGGEGLNRGEGFRPVTVLCLYEATARVSLLEGIEVEAFVAATRNLIVLRVRSRRGDRLPAALELRPESRVQSPESLLPQPTTLDPGPATRFRHDGPFRYLRQTFRDGSSAALCGFVYGARSHSSIREDAVVAVFEMPPSGECLILAGVAASQEDRDPAPLARAEVERALPHGYLLLQREHAVWWERFWGKLETFEGINCRDIYCSKVASRST